MNTLSLKEEDDAQIKTIIIIIFNLGDFFVSVTFANIGHQYSVGCSTNFLLCFAQIDALGLSFSKIVQLQLYKYASKKGFSR